VADLNTRDEFVPTDAGRVIRQELTELVQMPTVESICHDLAKLYSGDDLRRVYIGDDKVEIDWIEDVIEHYHQLGGLAPMNVLIDALTTLLRMMVLRVDWCPDLGRIVYQPMLPHWVYMWTHDRYPLTHEMAYAVAWSESTMLLDDKGEASSSGAVWCAYVRPPLSSDPPYAPTWEYPEGRLVRYHGGTTPWPLPSPEDRKIIVEDGVNPFVSIGGLELGERLVWNPLVFNYARPPIEGVHVPPDTSLVNVCLEIDIAFSLCMRLANIQSNGQPVMKGGGSAPTELGPQTLVKITDATGDFYFAAPTANIDSYLNAIRALFQTYAMLRKLAPDSWSPTRPSIQTGPAKQLEQIGLTEVRWEKSLMADEYEARRFEIERLYHNAWGEGAEIPRSVSQSVHWGEMRIPIDRMAQVQRLSQELAIGAISRLDAIMEIWGVDRVGAAAKMIEIDGDIEEDPENDTNPDPATDTGDQTSDTEDGEE
jgi:hypothetical protein